jgi:hypothetical protein
VYDRCTYAQKAWHIAGMGWWDAGNRRAALRGMSTPWWQEGGILLAIEEMKRDPCGLDEDRLSHGSFLLALLDHLCSLASTKSEDDLGIWGDTTLHTTTEHPFLTTDHGWVDVQDLILFMLDFQGPPAIDALQ